MLARSHWRILLSVACDPDPGKLKGGEQLPNPLAIGVTLGGLLLDVIVPRPKPRAGLPQEPSLLSGRTVPRTPQRDVTIEAYDGPPVASGYRS
jgi:hypothetical protein